MRVSLQRDRVFASINVIDNTQTMTTAIFEVVRITLSYKSGMVCVIQRVGTNGWGEFVKAFWNGSQYTIEEIAEIIEEVRTAGAMEDMDKQQVVVNFREPSLLTEHE